MCTRNDFAAHHAWPVEACIFDNPYLQLVPHNQANSPLLSPTRGDYRLVAHNFLPQVVVAVNRVQNICLCQKNQVVFPNLHVPYGLGGSKSTSVPYIVSDEVDLWGAAQSAPQRQRHLLDPFSTIVGRAGESYRHYSVPAPPTTHGAQKP